MKTAPKTRPPNVMSFVLEGRWPLDGFDQRELRRRSKIAKRNGVGVADVIYEAIESFAAKCEAEAEACDTRMRLQRLRGLSKRLASNATPSMKDPMALWLTPSCASATVW